MEGLGHLGVRAPWRASRELFAGGSEGVKGTLQFHESLKRAAMGAPGGLKGDSGERAGVEGEWWLLHVMRSVPSNLTLIEQQSNKDIAFGVRFEINIALLPGRIFINVGLSLVQNLIFW